MSDTTTRFGDDLTERGSEPDDRLARWNAWVLSVAQALYGINAMAVITVGGLVGQTLADDKSLATLPVSLMLLGSALATAPASLLMQRIGRRPGFMLGAAFGLASGLLAAYAIVVSSFALFCLATHLSGYYQAFAVYYRFAAADTASIRYRPRAISWVLAGGVAAAFVVPPLVVETEALLAPAFYAGTFVALAGLNMLAMTFLTLLEIPRVDETSHGYLPARPMREILAQPRLLGAIAAGMVSYGMMSLVMTATPLAMIACDHSIGDAAGAIRWHVVAMYAPSFFTGALIARFGRERIVLSGLVLLAACSAVALSGLSLTQFTVAMVLLGIGWNFGFIGATAIVTECHRPSERGKVQAFNDLVVFGFVAFCSFMSGKMLHSVGWEAINLVVFPAVGLAFLVVLFLQRRPERGIKGPLTVRHR